MPNMALIMLVDDVDEALSYHEKALGARLPCKMPQTKLLEWVSLLLDEVEIMFWQKEAAQREYSNPLPIAENPANFIAYIYTDDLDTLHDRIKDKINVIM